MAAHSANGPGTGFDFELGIPGFNYSDLFDAVRLKELADVFYAEVQNSEPALGEALSKYIAAGGEGFEKRAESKILTDAAPYLSNFVARMFKIEKERSQIEKTILADNPTWKYKFFVQRQAVKTYKSVDVRLESEAMVARPSTRDVRARAWLPMDHEVREPMWMDETRGAAAILEAVRISK